jgi:hypothetical protein
MPDCHPAELPIFFIPFEEHKKIELPDKDLVEIRDFFICKKCDARTNITSIPEKAHTEGQWSVISEPTCINVGQQVLKCSICDTVLKTESLPVTDHLFNNWETISAATYTNAGTEARTCSVCGTTETRVLAKLEKTSTSTTATPVLELNVKSLPLKVKQTFSGG